MSSDSGFKLTYGTMFSPPEELHIRFEEALSRVKADLGKEHGMIIDGKDRFSTEKFEDRSPVNTDWVLGVFQKGTEEDAWDALRAARRAFPVWSRMKWQDRVALVRKAADLIDERLFEMGAVMALEVGKNRMESLGDVAETADLLRYACDQMEANGGFIVEMGRDPVAGLISTNVSVMRPYGVWVVISPFNFPAALTGGPTGSALVTGNTVVFKPASDTPWIPRLLAECLRDAGVPDGVFNYVTGPGGTLGQALISSPEVSGITFTGSYDVGMGIYRNFCSSKWIRPIILELGGKNPAIVTANADLDTAAIGIVRSSFGLQGQKCSACSRILVHESVYDELVPRLVNLTQKLVVGDPTERSVYMGPVINRSAYRDFQNFVEDLSQHSQILTGGRVLQEGALGKGYFAAPTLAAGLPYDHPLWQQEMFLPISTVGKFKTLDEALNLANSVDYGLTAGIYGSQDEIELFYERIEAGVTYANRPLGATTGAWPGFQPFGGWKGSGSSGKNAGGVHYLQLYMHEQIRNLVRKAA